MWVRQLKKKGLSTTEAKCIAISKSMRDILPFVSIMKKIGFILELQGGDRKVLCSISKNPITFYEDNQGAIALAVSPQI